MFDGVSFVVVCENKKGVHYERLFRITRVSVFYATFASRRIKAGV